MALEMRTQTINGEQTFAVYSNGTYIGVFSYLDNAKRFSNYVDAALKRGEPKSRPFTSTSKLTAAMPFDRETAMNLRLEDLQPHQKEAVERVIRQARAMGRRVAETVGGTEEAYAYPAPHGGISWGYNGEPHGFCIARGIDMGR